MLHANIAKIDRRMVGKKDKSANLRVVLEALWLQNAPSLKSHVTHCIKNGTKQFRGIFVNTVNGNIF